MFDPKSQQFYTLNENSHHLGIHNLSARVKSSVQNYENYNMVNDADIQFRTQNTNTQSHVYSPPLWKSTSMTDHGNLSPNSRTRVVAKAQRELMEMARSMPESCYELSLRDIVENPILDSPKSDDETRCLFDENNTKFETEKIIRQESKKMVKKVERVKSDNFENGGLFLKMMFPVSISTKRKKNLYGSSNSKRVSPKVESLGKSSSSEKDSPRIKKLGSSGRKIVESVVTSISNIGSKNDGNSIRVSPKVETLGKSSSSEKESPRKKIPRSSESKSVESIVTSMSNIGSKNVKNIDDRRIIRNNVKVSTSCWSFALSMKNKRKSK